MMRWTLACLLLAAVLQLTSQAVNVDRGEKARLVAAAKTSGLPKVIDHYAMIEGEEYFIGMDKVNWNQAVRNCSALGMRLVSLNEVMKDLYVVNYLNSISIPSSYYWTSGLQVEKTFVWTGLGEVFALDGWMLGQPSGYYPNKYGLCVHSKGADKPLSSWQDFDCNYENHYVCEH